MSSIFPVSSRFVRWAIVPLAAALAAGCAKPRPQVTPEQVALVVPPVPPRVLSTPEAPDDPVVDAQPELPLTMPPARAPRGQAVTGKETRESAPAAGTGEAQQPAADPAQAGGMGPAGPPAGLQTPQTQNEPEAARKIIASIVSAEDDLGRVDYAALNQDAKLQYDTAKRFIVQVREALKVKNYVFGSYLADKAATIARELARR